MNNPANNVFHGESGRYKVRHLWDAAKGLPIKTLCLKKLLSRIIRRGIIDRPEDILDSVEEIRRCLNSDLRHPIILTPDGIICDGYHRFARCILEKRRTIRCQQLKEMPRPLKGARNE
jgi:hypothetical protein